MPSAFWSTEVYPGKPAQIELGEDQLLHIGGACLGPPSRGGGDAGGDDVEGAFSADPPASKRAKLGTAGGVSGPGGGRG